MNNHPVSIRVGSALRILLLWSFLVTNLPTLAAGDEAIRDRFLENAPAAWESYLRMIEHVAGTFNFSQVDRLKEDKVVWASKTHVKLTPTHSLFILEDQPGQQGPTQARVTGFNSEYAFQLARPTTRTDWAIDSYTPYRASGSPIDSVALRQSSVRSLCQGLVLWSETIWLPSVLKDEGFSVIDAREFEQDGEKLVRIEFQYQPQPPDRNPIREGFMIFDPERYWMLRGAELKSEPVTGGKGTITLKDIAYVDDPAAKLPLIKRYVANIRGENKDGDVSEHDWIWDFDLQYQPEIADSEFRLAAFGLPEPSVPTGTDRTWVILLAAFGVACLGGAIALRRWANSREMSRAA